MSWVLIPPKAAAFLRKSISLNYTFALRCMDTFCDTNIPFPDGVDLGPRAVPPGDVLWVVKLSRGSSWTVICVAMESGAS